MSLKTLISNVNKKDSGLIRALGVEAGSLSFFASDVQQKLKKPVLLVVNDHATLERTLQEISFYFPKEKIIDFPAWDVQPYDRVSADGEIQARRMQALSALQSEDSFILITTVNALSIRTPPKSHRIKPLHLKTNARHDRDEAVHILESCGYLRVGTVMEPGEYAVRGSLLDVFVAGEESPVRVDFFDDEIESIKTFDPVTQRSEEEVIELMLKPFSEMVLTEDKIRTFRMNYRTQFADGMNDGLYKDISDGRKNDMMSHFLPLFFDEKLPTLIDFLPQDTVVIADALSEKAMASRLESIEESYQSRVSMLETELKESNDPYRPLLPQSLYMQSEEWKNLHERVRWIQLEHFDDGGEFIHLPFKPAVVEKDLPSDGNRTDKALALALDVKAGKGHVIFSALSPSSLARMENTLSDKGWDNLKLCKTWKEAIHSEHASLITSPVEWGFYDEDKNLLLLTEQDLFGERQNRPARSKKRKPEEVIGHFSELQSGDLVVHNDHGIGRFEGLQTIDVDDSVQDFILLIYAGGDKLYVPVVNLDVLSKFGGDEHLKLDKLGGTAWQIRKAKVKKDLMAMAGELIDIAANRKIMKGHRYAQPDGLFNEFCAGFPYIPTTEQQKAVEDIEADMYSDNAMDRLVVGDVGFGKTEVALRAAFVAAADGKQVAVIVPTTLLARQHHDVFHKRFAKFPFKVSVLSRLVTGKQKATVLEGLKKGEVDIVIGTHALLSDSVKFKDLGLLIVDEEQRFGVAHKEKLKKLKANVDVLTLTATPIPRTLQMSLSGLRSLSLITTPPVDRLAVRTYVMKYDAKVMREAILREKFRGGQVFVVTPRVDGLQKLADSLQELVPEVKVRIAHGQMPKDGLDRTMTDFYDGHFDVLVSTTIIESGIDVPRANTLIVHRADRFGLAQLYQIRGRVGRSKVRAYAYFLLPQGGMTDNAVKRLKILQRLDGVGAGFTLASYDMDIRGAGNILGKEQSGHVKEVGFELYNKMLQEAIEATKAEQQGENYQEQGTFVPSLNIGLSFLIPENYVPDLHTRVSLYRRLSAMHEQAEIEEFRDELHDRFGELPEEVSALLQVIHVKNRCLELNVEKIDVGPKGAVLTFYQGTFSKPQELLQFIMQNAGIWSFKPDGKIVVHRPLPEGLKRLESIAKILSELEEL